MGLLKRKEEKTEVIWVRVPGSAKAELDELRQRAEAGGFDLAGSMSEAVVRIIRQIGAELRDAAGTATDPSNAVRPQRRSDVARPTRYGVGLIVAAWSGRRLTPPGLPSRYVVGACVASLPVASVPCIRECSKPAHWQCGVGLTCCARFLR
jgi:hypothetical protein